MSIQYTIRAIPESLDEALRLLAKKQSKSLNTIVIETLMRQMDISIKPSSNHDLDFLINSWQEDPEFDKAIAEQGTIDEEMWK